MEAGGEIERGKREEGRGQMRDVVEVEARANKDVDVVIGMPSFNWAARRRLRCPHRGDRRTKAPKAPEEDGSSKEVSRGHSRTSDSIRTLPLHQRY